jgi:hypothetical protein
MLATALTDCIDMAQTSEAGNGVVINSKDKSG